MSSECIDSVQIRIIARPNLDKLLHLDGAAQNYIQLRHLVQLAQPDRVGSTEAATEAQASGKGFRRIKEREVAETMSFSLFDLDEGFSGPFPFLWDTANK